MQLFFHLAVIFFVCVSLFFSDESFAERYSISRGVTLSGLYDDNQRLRNNELPNATLSGAGIAADLGLSRSSGVRTEFLNLSVDEKLYDDSSYNRTSVAGAAGLQRVGERSRFLMNLSANRNSVRDFELSESGNGAVEDFRSRRASTQSIGLNWEQQLTERNRLELNASVRHQDFESEQFRGSITSSGSIELKRNISPRLTAQASLSYVNLNSDDSLQIIDNPNRLVDFPSIGTFDVGVQGCMSENTTQEFTFAGAGGVAGFSGDCNKLRFLDNDQDNFIAELGFIYHPTEIISIDMSVGQSRVDTTRLDSIENLPGAVVGDSVEDTTINTANNALSYSFTGTLKWKKSKLRLTADTSENTNSNGILRRNKVFKFEGNHRLTERATLSLFLDYLDQSAVSSEESRSSDRENSGGGLKLSYRFSEVFSMNFSQRHITQERKLLDSTTSKNITNLSFAWKPVDHVF